MTLGLSLSLAKLSAPGSDTPAPPLSTPVFVQQPSLSGAFIAGLPVTLSLGLATPGALSFSIVRFELDGVDKRSDVVGLVWETNSEDISVDGTITYQVQVENAAGLTLSEVITATLVPAPPPPDWEFSVQDDASFNILASLAGPQPPLSSDTGGGLVLLGEPSGWLIDHATDQSFRIVNSLFGAESPLVTEAGANLIQIGE